MAKDFIGRVVGGKYCREIEIPSADVAFARIAGEMDVAFSINPNSGELRIWSITEYGKGKKEAEADNEKEAEE